MLRLIAIGLFFAFLFCYLEWGADHAEFFFQLEYTILFGGTSAKSFLHPLIWIPFVGQLMLVYSLFQKNPHKRLILIGAASLGVLVLLVFTVGILTGNLKISLSTVPFLLLFVIFIVITRKKQNRLAKL